MIDPKVIDAIQTERNRQDAKFAEQHHAPGTWLLIAVEELGEVSQTVLRQDRQAYMTELIQATAVMVAWLEFEMTRSDV